MKKILLFIAMASLITSCGHRYRKNQDQNGQNFTLGQVQLKIKKGMSQTAVAQSLGSPNIVTQDSDGQQAWIYDKMSSSVEYYNSSGGFWLILVGGGGSRGAATTTQNTLTVVIKFDESEKVQNVTYHSSRY